ncbi:MAG: hypothetical protein R3277_13330 [Brumimicrobium sp.]|nr:hypothetical protein [Brumimicrobium sp.]
MIKRTEVKELANIQSEFCVSIYIPTHSGGQETLEGQDRINLKTQLKEVRSKLEERGMKENELDAFVQPVQDLVDDSNFWRYQSDGLAVFLAKDLFRYFSVPVSFEPFNYVSNEFYLKPLMPLFHGNGMYYILTLKEDDVALYEATKHSMVQLELPDSVPQQLEDRVGYDYEQKSLQFRSEQQGNQKAAMYHGHGEGSAEEQNELKRYFRAIDKGLMEMLHDDQNPPMVVCCQDEQFALYKDVNNYKNLFDKNLSMNPADLSDEQLHERTWSLIKSYFEEQRTEKMKNFAQFHGTGKATSDPRVIMRSAVQGKVDALFIARDSEIYGNYDPKKMEIEIEDERKASNTSLMNVIAMKVFELGGEVYLTDKEEMPDDSSEMNALMRF